jgi:hypothetical protein
MIYRSPPHPRRRRRYVARTAIGLLVLAISGGALLALGAFGSPEAAVGELASAPSGGAVGPPSQASASIEPTAPSTAGGSPSPEPSLPGASGGTPPSPVPSSAAPSSPTPEPAASAGPFAMDLYQEGAFVSELTKMNCVPAAMQTMINMMTGATDRSLATQNHLYALARRLSPKTLTGPGAEPEGWAAGLVQLGYGSYAVTVEPTMVTAIHAAATAIRMTGRPAGLLVWYGAHAWVMSGFRATADPALTDRFTVTDVYIEDVWYPRVSSIWGRSRSPDAVVPIKRLPRDFLPWRMPGGPYPDKLRKFVVVLPAPPPGSPDNPAPRSGAAPG